MPPLLMPGPGLGPLGYARGGARVPQSRFSLAFAAASGQYVSFGSVPSFTNLTLSAWVKPADLSVRRTIFDGSDDGSGGVILIVRTAGEGRVLQWWPRPFGDVVGTLPLTPDAWDHVAVTWDGATSRLYVNGVADGSTGGTAPGTPNVWKVGSSSNGGAWGYWDGLIDDALVCASALSPAQIAALAAGTLDPATLTTAGLWRFEEGSGLTTADASGNGNTGTLTNGPTWSTDTPSALQ